MQHLVRAGLAAAFALLSASALAEPNYESWSVLKSTFPSTGGDGTMIGEYNPVIVGNKCSTAFTATGPDGKVHRNFVEFDAVPKQGGTLCTNGKWRSADGNMQGTTPFEVFFKDGVVRGSQ